MLQWPCVLCLILGFMTFFSACGGDTDDDVNGSDPSDQTTQASSSAETNGSGASTENSSDSTNGGETEASSVSETTGDVSYQETTDITENSLDVPPTEGLALFEYLKAGSYKHFPSESQVHASQGPHGNVKTYFNPILDASFAAGNEVHPKDSAAVKELYRSDMVTLLGWSVSVKTQENSHLGEGWYWYEIFSTTDPANPIADGNGVTLCTGCHSTNSIDFVLTPYPLE